MLYSVLFGLRFLSLPSPFFDRRRADFLPGLCRPDTHATPPSCRTWDRVFFILLVLILLCSLTVPSVAQAGEKQGKAIQHSVHKQGVQTYQKKGSYPWKPTRWNVCRDMVKNLDLLQQSDASYSCELKFHPSMTQFSEPEWEELKIEDHWQLLYFFDELHFRRDRARPFAEWQAQYILNMRAGYENSSWPNGKLVRLPFHPRLRMTKVRFEKNGPLITVIAYARERNYENICKMIENKCHSTIMLPDDFDDFSSKEYKEHFEKSTKCQLSTEQYIVGQEMGVTIDTFTMDYGDNFWTYKPGATVQRDDENKAYQPGLGVLVPIYNDDPEPIAFGPPYRLFLYKKRAYLASGYRPGLGQIHAISRVEESPLYKYHGWPWELNAQGICRVRRYLPSPQ